MGSRLTEDWLARGGLEYIRVRDVGWSSCRSRVLNRPETVSWRERRRQGETSVLDRQTAG